jgi:hypothetical protein
MLKFTLESHPDRAQIQRALAGYEAMCNAINETKRSKDVQDGRVCYPVVVIQWL